MTRRSESSGQSKTPGAETSASRPPSPAPNSKAAKSLREYRSRAEREAEIQRYVILGTVIATVIVVVIIAVAFLFDQIINPNQVVANVNGDTITVAEFQQRVRLERALLNDRINNGIAQAQMMFGAEADPNQAMNFLFQQEPYATWLNEIQVPDQLGNRVLNDMIDDVVVRQAAAARGITVTEADIQGQIEQMFGFDPMIAAEATAEVTETAVPTSTPTPFVSPTPSPTPTITPTPEFTPTPTNTPFPTVSPAPTLNPTELAEQFNEQSRTTLDDLRRRAGISEADLNRFFEFQALRERLRDSLGEELDDEALYTNVRHILVATEDEARDVLAALENGESFADLARSVSTDTGSGAQGGELDWAPLTNYVQPFADAVREAPIGQIVGPVQSEFGYHIIQVRARELRPMTEADIESAKNRALSEFVETTRDAAGDSIQTNSIWTANVPDDPPFQPLGF